MNKTNAGIIKPLPQGPGNKTNAGIIKPLPQGPANKTNAGIIKPLPQGPANKTNTEIVKSQTPAKSSLQILSDAATGASANLKDGGLGNAVKAIPGVLSRTGSSIARSLSQGNDALHRSIGENIAGNTTLASLGKGAKAEIARVGGELAQGRSKVEDLFANNAAKIGAALAVAKSDFDKKQAAQAIVLKQSRANAQKASEAQRKMQQEQARKAVFARN